VSPEFDLIARYFTRPAPTALLGVGDDCALVQPQSQAALAITTDTLVAGRHFFADVDAASLGHKCLAVNLSDLAAMGATPRWFTLALTVPRIDHAWLAAFAGGLFALAERAGTALVGGDTTAGPLAIGITALGEVPPGLALRRAGARAGDGLWVSGALGEAALAVAVRKGRLAAAAPDWRRLDWPLPRLALGEALRGVASAAIDVSDGLVADLGHICAASGVGAVIDWPSVPLGASLAALPEGLRRDFALAGGDDYELCFAVPAEGEARVADIARRADVPLTRIGQFVEDGGVRVRDAAGRAVELAQGGFDHFRPAT
jgi:thiamine-monophosphate kinase